MALKRLKFTQDLSAAALDYQTPDTKVFDLRSVQFTVDGPINETVKITIADEDDSDYDVVIYEQALTALENFVWVPEVGGQRIPIAESQQVKIEVTNAGAAQSVFGSILIDI